jgi:oxygen-independent coproporphyrinogen-3 oxidase
MERMQEVSPTLADKPPVQETLGVYISIPFCKAKCIFCNFASGAFGLDRLDGYVERLCDEIRRTRADAREMGAELPARVDSVYFGGGTPSLLAPKQLNRIFAALRGEFAIEHGDEITLECAPGQIASETLDEALRQGVNRVSFGVQSFVDEETAAVGRLHTAADCRAEIARMRAAGGDSISVKAISVDLIAGLPGQTAESWERSLDAVIAAQVPHASVYMLEVDDESRLGKELIAGGPRYGARSVPNDEAMTEFYTRACERFGEAGLMQYEISNFARPGCESKHNLKYWLRKPYVGFGVDAHSMLRTRDGAVRFANTDELDVYLAGVAREVTQVDRDAAFEEALFLGLRMNAGVSLLELEDEFGRGRVQGCTSAMRDLTDGGLLRRDGELLMLTERGRMVSNEVFGELLRGVAA